jgi:N-acetylglucosamine-6-phosphate deacetylase
MNMPPEWQAQNQANKLRWFGGNRDAVDFVNCLFDAVELWDDLIDRDVEVQPDHINRVFLSLMFTLPANRWFSAHKEYYLPLIMTAINGFHDSNAMSTSDDKKMRNMAFHIRNFGIELHIATAFLIGGYQHMREVSAEIREFFAFETFEEWESDHA